MALDRESDNSDDPSLRRQVNAAGEKLKTAIADFVQASKADAGGGGAGWKSSSDRLLVVVVDVGRLFGELNMYGLDSARQAPPIVVTPPPRPPLPHEVRVPGRPPMPAHDTDDEEGLFSGEPGMKKPIHAAAHGLYQEVSKVGIDSTLML